MKNDDKKWFDRINEKEQNDLAKVAFKRFVFILFWAFAAWLACYVFISCEDYNHYKNGVDNSSKKWESTKPAFMCGLYGTDRPDSEPGQLIFMSDRVIIQTTNHHHEFKYSEYMNAIGTYDNGKDCNWSIHVNDIEYRFTTSSEGKYTIFSFKRVSENQFNRIGVYYKDYKQEEPINNNN